MVFDQPSGLDLRFVSRLVVHWVVSFSRKKVFVPPDTERAFGDAVLAHYLRYGSVIVDDFEWSEAEITHV